MARIDWDWLVPEQLSLWASASRGNETVRLRVANTAPDLNAASFDFAHSMWSSRLATTMARLSAISIHRSLAAVSDTPYRSAYGVLALLESDADARHRALADGEAQLAKASVSHNHISLREYGIDACLQAGEWQAAEDNCSNLERFTSAEPLPLSDFLIARGRALARFGRGERDAPLLAGLLKLRDEAVACELNVALPALEKAIGALQ